MGEQAGNIIGGCSFQVNPHVWWGLAYFPGLLVSGRVISLSPFLERKPPLVFLRPFGLAKVELEKQDLGFKDGVEPPVSKGPKKRISRSFEASK